VSKRSWQKSSNGPDWTDLKLFMSEIEKFHEVLTSVSLTPADGKKSPSLKVVVMSSALSVPTKAGTCIYTTEGEWPGANGRTLEGTVYFLLHQHDAHLSEERWDQDLLWQ